MSIPVHRTGIQVDGYVLAEMQRAMEPTLKMDIAAGMTITTPGDPRKALNILKEFALSKGLPELLPTYNYCLGGDNQREIVCNANGWPKQKSE